MNHDLLKKLAMNDNHKHVFTLYFDIMLDTTLDSGRHNEYRAILIGYILALLVEQSIDLDTYQKLLLHIDKLNNYYYDIYFTDMEHSR